jgi:hypothetical protein
MEAVYFSETSVNLYPASHPISRLSWFSLLLGVFKEYWYSILTSLRYKDRNLNTEKLDTHIIGF